MAVRRKDGKWSLSLSFAVPKDRFPVVEQISMPPLMQAFWQPNNILVLNPKEIATWSYLRSDSRLIPYLEHPEQLTAMTNGSAVPGVGTAPTGR